MKKLDLELEKLIANTKGDQKIIKNISKEKDVYPFTYENRLLSYFLSIGEISYNEYCQLIHEYFKRNKYLYLFDMSPRTFGQTWGEKHILSLFPQFIKATKKNLLSKYPGFDGEFDLWIDGIRIEVKACRANSTKTNEILAKRAYSHSEAKSSGFKYHFQQIKPSCSDIFIWIGTCRDKLLYWILTTDEVIKTKKLAPQHRNENTGSKNKKIFEGQIFMTEEELAPFIVDEKDILKKVLEKGK